MENKTHLGEAMRVQRTIKGLNQAEMAGLIGVKQQTIGDWERSGTVPAGRHQQIIEHYGLNPVEYTNKNVTADNQSNAAGRDMRVTHAQKPLTAKQQVLIELLDEKDPGRKIIERFLQELLAL